MQKSNIPKNDDFRERPGIYAGLAISRIVGMIRFG